MDQLCRVEYENGLEQSGMGYSVCMGCRVESYFWSSQAMQMKHGRYRRGKVMGS